MRPRRLRDRLAREVLRKDWFDVEHRCAVDGIESLDDYRATRVLDKAHDRAPNSVGPVLAALSENADKRPVRVVAGMASSSDDSRRIDPVEAVDDLQVREILYPRKRVVRHRGRKLDRQARATPEVIFW